MSLTKIYMLKKDCKGSCCTCTEYRVEVKLSSEKRVVFCSLSHMDPADFEIFTSIRSDDLLKRSPYNTNLSGAGEPSQFYMLCYHRDRLISAANHFNWTEVITFLSGSASAHILEAKLLEHLLHKYGSSSCLEPLKVPSGNIYHLLKDL